MEISCLGLDQDAVADQVAGDQLFDWGLWLSAIRLSSGSQDQASIRILIGLPSGSVGIQ